MSKQTFIADNYPLAKQAEEQTGVPALFAIAQSALESGWGKHAPKNMLFGIKVGSGKDFGGWKGEKQLITTTEYGSKSTLQFPFIYPGFPTRLASGKWKYKVKDYFRAYPSRLYAFLDWSGLLSKASRYKKAMNNANDPYRFADEVAKAGYATSPTYASKIKAIMRDIEGELPEKTKPTKPKPTGVAAKKIRKNLFPVLLVTIGTAIVFYTTIKSR